MIVPIVQRIIASRPLLVSVRRVAGVLDHGAIRQRIQLQPDGTKRPVAREIRPARAGQLWRKDQPQIGYHLANFGSERVRK